MSGAITRSSTAAAGSASRAAAGRRCEEVNRVLKQFVEMRKMLKAMGGMAGGGMKGAQRLKSMLRGR